MIRRYCVALCSVFMLHMVSPPPAVAWWDYLEQFSGPGPTPFAGDIQLRLLCYPEPDPTQVTTDARDVHALGGAFIALCLNRRGTAFPPRRVVSIDVGVLAAWIPPDEQFAENRSVWFTNVTPAVTWNFIPNRRFDFIEYGFGAGFYRFISRGFTPVSGGYLEPLRVDFHVPTEWRYQETGGALKRVLRRMVVRVSPMLFPGGFDEDAFRPIDAVRKPPRTEWVTTVAVFVDLEGWFYIP